MKLTKKQILAFEIGYEIARAGWDDGLGSIAERRNQALSELPTLLKICSEIEKKEGELVDLDEIVNNYLKME